MHDNFYRAFEERFYAPQSVIKTLRKQYLGFVEPLSRINPGLPAFDAGCGRGEWLELMSELGLSPYGVDLDEGMLSACIEKSLPAHRADAVDHLRTLPTESHLIISAFHVIEHIPFDKMRLFIAEAYRALKPGGLLILETPNTENLYIATRNFYLDPTHQRPIPILLLAFVIDYAGFAQRKILRLQEQPDLHTKTEVTLSDIFNGPSPDYAIVAQKGGDPTLLAATKAAFEREYGLSLDSLIGRWDSYLSATLKETSDAASGLKRELARIAEQQEAAQTLITDIGDELRRMQQSKSWRMTAPLRAVMRAAKNIRGRLLGSKSSAERRQR